MTTALPPKQNKEYSEQRVVLRNVGWDTYESLLRDLEDSSAPRLTYDRGTLEIMRPVHERHKRALEAMLDAVVAEWGIPMESLGSATFRREELARGFEPDSCFYFENAERVRGRDRLDLTVDPAPDLIVEIDMTHSSVDKFAIFQEIGVAEVWRYDGIRLSIRVLESGRYYERDVSKVLPRLSRAAIEALMAERSDMIQSEWLQRIRLWAREQLG